MTKVRYQLTREIPEWKAMLEGRPATVKEEVEVEVWEHQTRGLESLARAFATLKTQSVAEIESGDVLFIRPPDVRKRKHFKCQPYCPMELSIGLPTLREGDDAQKVADEFFAAARSIYREGCELAARVVKTLLELPEEAWDSPHEISLRYADPITVRGFSAAAAINVACRKLGLPEDYLTSLFVQTALKKHKKLCAHWEGIANRHQAEREAASERVRAQHAERSAEIEKVHEANRAKFLELFLETCTEADRERYERGFVSKTEMKDRVRDVLFGGFGGTHYRHMDANDFCDQCEDVEFSVVEDTTLNAEQFDMLKEVEAYFTAPEFSLKIRKHWASCDCDTVGQATVLVTWHLPGADPLSREYEIGFAITP